MDIAGHLGTFLGNLGVEMQPQTKIIVKLRDDPSWPQEGLRRPHDWPSWPQDGPRWPKMAPGRVQDGTEMAPSWVKMVSKALNKNKGISNIIAFVLHLIPR